MLLSIVTTADPYQGIMAALVEAVQRFAISAVAQVEIVIVDDLGVMASSGVVSGAASPLVNVRIIDDRQGRGQDMALIHGAYVAAGDVIVTMDPDMFENVVDIPRLLDAYRNGADVVYTRRLGRMNISLPRRFFSHAYNFLVRVLTGARLHDINTPMALFSARTKAIFFADPGAVSYYKLYLHFRFFDTFKEVDIDVSNVRKSRSSYRWSDLVRLFFFRISMILRNRAKMRAGKDVP